MRSVLRFVLLLTLVLLWHSPSLAASMSIDIFGPGQAKTNIIQAAPAPASPGGAMPSAAESLRGRIERNLKFMPFLRVVPAADVMGGVGIKGPTAQDIDFRRFQLSKVDLLITSGWRSGSLPSTVELRAYEVGAGNLVLGKAYEDVRDVHVNEVADRFCAELMRLLTGSGDFFSSKIAFVRSDGQAKNIWEVKPTGEGLRKLTNLPGICMSPAWSPDGSTIAFTYIGERSHMLGIVGADGGKPQLISQSTTSVISPNYTADGRLAVSLDIKGNPDIWLLDGGYKPVRTLAEGWGLDISPTFDANGQRMAFVSGRQGNPQIFLASMGGGEAQRITYAGRNNTEPTISPDGRLLAFTRDMPEGQRIFFYDLTTGQEKQITFGPGKDQSPAWAPDGYFLCFSSTRTGASKVYVTTRQGDEPFQVDTGGGEAKEPRWARLSGK